MRQRIVTIHLDANRTIDIMKPNRSYAMWTITAAACLLGISLPHTVAATTPNGDEPSVTQITTFSQHGGDLRQPHGNGSVRVTGEQKAWHKVTLTLDGPYAHEQDNAPNPFTDYRMTVDVPTFATVRPTLSPATSRRMATQRTRPPNRVRNGGPISLPTESAIGLIVRVPGGKHAALDRHATAKSLPPFDGKSGNFRSRPATNRAATCEPTVVCNMLANTICSSRASKQYFLKVGCRRTRNAARLCRL